MTGEKNRLSGVCYFGYSVSTYFDISHEIDRDILGMVREKICLLIVLYSDCLESKNNINISNLKHFLIL